MERFPKPHPEIEIITDVNNENAISRREFVKVSFKDIARLVGFAVALVSVGGSIAYGLERLFGGEIVVDEPKEESTKKE